MASSPRNHNALSATEVPYRCTPVSLSTTRLPKVPFSGTLLSAPRQVSANSIVEPTQWHRWRRSLGTRYGQNCLGSPRTPSSFFPFASSCCSHWLREPAENLVRFYYILPQEIPRGRGFTRLPVVPLHSTSLQSLLAKTALSLIVDYFLGCWRWQTMGGLEMLWIALLLEVLELYLFIFFFL